jgi:hypothetical protein
LDDLNILKEFDIFDNTLLLDNLNKSELSYENMIKKELLKIKSFYRLD